MVTLAEKFKKLKTDYEEKLKKINNIIDNFDDMSNELKPALEKVENAMEQMEESFKSLENLVYKVNIDYTRIKTDIENIKKNKWLRFFGIK